MVCDFSGAWLYSEGDENALVSYRGDGRTILGIHTKTPMDLYIHLNKAILKKRRKFYQATIAYMICPTPLSKIIYYFSPHTLYMSATMASVYVSKRSKLPVALEPLHLVFTSCLEGSSLG